MNAAFSLWKIEHSIRILHNNSKKMTHHIADISKLIRNKALYPDSDGEPMSDNTLQFFWITMLKGNLDILYAEDPNVFVAGDLLWYPVLGAPKVRVAPDTLVAFGRPKGYRGSYRQWEEDNIPPQVVFEVISPSNTAPEMINKHKFYEKYGVEEFVLIDPDKKQFFAWERHGDRLQSVELEENGWTSKKLKIHIKKDVDTEELIVSYPDGRPFMDHIALNNYAEEQKQIAVEQAQIAEEQKQIAEQERKAKEDLQAENERLKAKLRELGLLDE